MQGLAALTIGLLLVLASCTSGNPPGASASPSASPQASASAGASASPPPVAFDWVGADPVVTRELAGLPEEQYINPGAVVEHEEQLHMFANLFTAWPGRVRVAHLVSADGLAWESAAAEPILASDDVPFANPGIDVSTGFVADDGTWVLIFETVESGPWAIGRATAPGPDGPWSVDPGPILEPGAAGSWDAGGLAWPSVVRLQGRWAMYYTAFDRPRGTGAIGMATSADGTSWTKHEGPVLEAEADWELGKLDRPRVVATPEGLLMVYAGGRLTDRGLASSTDGISWERLGDGPVISAADFPVSGRAWDAALLYRAGRLHYWLEIGTTGAAGTQVYLATADPP